jgi:hypothetical protein
MKGRITDRLKYILNKIQTDEEEPQTSYYSLALHGHWTDANQLQRKGFIQEDYEDLRNWLNLDEAKDIEEAMEFIGLKSEEDLYEKEILTRENENETKSSIRDKLYNYIQNAKLKKFEKINPVDTVQNSSLASMIGKKVAKVFYRLIASGMILVPILVKPEDWLTGFALGSCFFIFKRFGVYGTRELAEEFIKYTDNNLILRVLRNFQVINLGLQEKIADRFADYDLIGKIRVINLLFVKTILGLYLNPRFNPAIGAFLQGIAFSHEFVNMI